VICVSVWSLRVWFGLLGYNSWQLDAKRVFCGCCIFDLAGGFNEPRWHGMAWIDNGTVVVGSSVCTFELAVVFVMFGDSAHKIGLPSYSICVMCSFWRGARCVILRTASC
jgi:hypothetical protein